MKQFLFLSLILFLISCHSTKEILVADNYFENEFLDTLVVTGKKINRAENDRSTIYRASASRSIDLLHTELSISFNMEERAVVGIARLSCRPYFYPIEKVEIDAVNFTINKIALIHNGLHRKLDHVYDGSKIVISLDREYSRYEEFTLFIDYIAYPEKQGSNRPFAIGSDQGLFFIDPDRQLADKPTQIWTQGETSYNSRWFPTIDQPNEKCTQEISVRVEDRYISLSNGVLIHSEQHSDNTRTDHWKLDLPHSPYLFALVVGEFAEVKDWWDGKEIGYYVYPEFEESARDIFKNTPEMLHFFSRITGVNYPWPGYKQVIVEDFISGAMENTSLVVFAESFQKSREELVDYPNDMIVAHEMFHHWFGNLVTCESWANLTLNEGFANYGEYLWMEHKYGYEEAEFYRDGEMGQYINSSQYNSHPLIFFEYEDKDGMFDVHSYNKGGLVLHMLRKYLGDEAFFAGMNKYLSDHAYSSAEAHDLRLAFEAVCGEDLNWFFNQWFFEEGFPQLLVTESYDDQKEVLRVRVEQKQAALGFPASFQAPVEMQVFFGDGSSKKEIIWIQNVLDSFDIACPEEPVAFLFNSDNNLLCTVEDEFLPGEYAFIFESDAHVVHRYEALMGLKFNLDYEALFEKALDDPSREIRRLGLGQVSAPLKPSIEKKIRNLAKNDSYPKVRAKAYRILKENKVSLSPEHLGNVISKDSSAAVLSICLSWLDEIDKGLALSYAEKLQGSGALMIQMAVGDIFADSGSEKYLAFFDSKLLGLNMYQLPPFLSSYKKLLFQQKPGVIIDNFNWLYDATSEMDLNYYRLNLFRSTLQDMIHFVKKYHGQGEKADGAIKRRVQKMEDRIKSYHLVR